MSRAPQRNAAQMEVSTMSKRTVTEVAPVDSAHVVILGEGEYDVPLPENRPVHLADLLGSIGVSNRGGQLFLDGRPAVPNAEVHANSEAILLPSVRGG